MGNEKDVKREFKKGHPSSLECASQDTGKVHNDEPN